MPRRLTVSMRKRDGLRAHVRVQMEGGVGVDVGVAVQARDAEALLGDLAVFGLVELLLRKRRQQQPHAFHLHRRHVADHSRRRSS